MTTLGEILTFSKTSPGNFSMTLDLDILYSQNPAGLQNFNSKWQNFLNSDQNLSKVVTRKGNTITYSHKSWLPEKNNNKPSVVFLFGNPAPHSVIEDIYFAYEGKSVEHRFWKVMRKLQWINISSATNVIKQRFFDLHYDSPFRLGFEVLFTFPSSASDAKWSGVAGLLKLFGKRAFIKLANVEKKRLEQFLDTFFAQDQNTIICFQKDAYENLTNQKYILSNAVSGNLLTKWNKIPVYGIPPTRWLHTTKLQNLLIKIRITLS